jgi:hypothetical protein
LAEPDKVVLEIATVLRRERVGDLESPDRLRFRSYPDRGDLSIK